MNNNDVAIACTNHAERASAHVAIASEEYICGHPAKALEHLMHAELEFNAGVARLSSLCQSASGELSNKGAAPC